MSSIETAFKWYDEAMKAKNQLKKVENAKKSLEEEIMIKNKALVQSHKVIQRLKDDKNQTEHELWKSDKLCSQLAETAGKENEKLKTTIIKLEKKVQLLTIRNEEKRELKIRIGKLEDSIASIKNSQAK